MSYSVVLFVSLQLHLQYLLWEFETCNIVQTCIEHVQRNWNFDPGHYCRIMSLLMTYILVQYVEVGLHSAVRLASDSKARDPGFDTCPAAYFCFSFRCLKKSSCQLLVKICAGSTGELLRRSKPAQEMCG